MALQKRSHAATLTGLIIPIEWNDDLEVVAVALAMPDEKECRILSNRKGRELFGFLQHQVEATGMVERDDRGRDVMTVRRYIVK
jgi:hypothetical protein